MNRSIVHRVLAGSLFVIAAVVAPVWAQDAKGTAKAAPTEESVDGLLPGFRTIDEILEQAVRNISARYNLNSEQQRYTENMMKTEVRKFLKDHHDQVWPVLRSMVGAQLNPASITKDPTEAQRIGKTARPLFDAATEAILRCNEEWRSVLTDDQKAMHDFDLGEMQKTFSHMSSEIKGWEDGKPSDKGIFPPVKAFPNEPKRPPVPAAGLPNIRAEKATSAEEGALTPDVFDAFVEAFIKDYELDPAQIESARKVLTEFKALAQNQYDTIKDQLAKVDNERQEAVIKRDRPAKEAADKKRKELVAPISEAFGKMKDRLNALPTTAQKERFAQKEAARKSAPAPKPKAEEKPADPKKEAPKPKAEKPKAEEPKKEEPKKEEPKKEEPNKEPAQPKKGD